MLDVHMQPHRIWSVVFLAKHYLHPARHAAHLPVLAPSPSPGEESSEQGDSVTRGSSYEHWTAGFLASLVALGALSAHVEGKYKVEMQPEDDLLAARGRPCWISCCAASIALLSLLTFVTTLFVLSASGQRRYAPVDSDLRKVGHPGERAYEAGQGVALSVALMGFLVLYRRHSHSVQISLSLLAQFAIRGATLSVLIASVLETSWIVGLTRVTGMPPSALTPSPGKQIDIVGGALTMIVVGLSEELGKAYAVICGTWLSAGALRLEAPHWLFRLWRVLVESPRALMLAGLCVGCGFMTLENVGYLLSAGVMTGDKDDSAAVERFVRCLVVAVRVGLNLHPWLCGITCARMARVAFGEERESLKLSCKELAWAVWPAAAAHGAFDFGLLCLPGIVAIFLPTVFWLGARWAFDREWAAFDSSARTLENDPSEEATAETAG